MKHLSVGEGPSFDISRLRGAAELARQDAETSERLRRQYGMPDPDERPENDPPPQCEVCGKDVVRSRRGAKSRASICRDCTAKGWRSRRCPCGNLLRTWDMGRTGWNGGHGMCRACKAARVTQ